jgi:hypothetical protein
MKFNDIANLRIKSQHIAAADFQSAADVVSWMGAMQAQDYAGALWAIGLRTSHLTQKDIEQAIINKEIVRTWPMRGTLHFVAAKDARWIVNLLAQRATTAAATRRKQLNITEADIAKSRQILEQTLSDGKEKTRIGLLDILERAGVSTAGQRGIHLLRYFSEQALLCFGPHAGKQPTFVLLESWLPKTKELSRDEALAELAIRYFKSHGPATLKDFTGWTKLTLGDARHGIALAGNNLQEEAIEGTSYWFDAALDRSSALHSNYLLPGFDEFMLGYKNRSPALPLEYSDRIVPGGNGVFRPTIVINGQVVGTWQRKVRTKYIEIDLHPFTSALHTGHVQDTADRYSRFLDIPVKINESVF